MILFLLTKRHLLMLHLQNVKLLTKVQLRNAMNGFLIKLITKLP